jgi:hypothetical protein
MSKTICDILNTIYEIFKTGDNLFCGKWCSVSLRYCSILQLLPRSKRTSIIKKIFSWHSPLAMITMRYQINNKRRIGLLVYKVRRILLLTRRVHWEDKQGIGRQWTHWTSCPYLHLYHKLQRDRLSPPPRMRFPASESNSSVPLYQFHHWNLRLRKVGSKKKDSSSAIRYTQRSIK